jgi:hypothetical protein
MQVVNLQHQYHLLAESLTKTKTSLDDEDNSMNGIVAFTYSM